MKRLSIFLFLLLAVIPLRGASWKLDRAATMVDCGRKVQLNVSGDVPGRIRWQSSDKRVARVNRKGIVRGRSKGDAVITALCPETGDEVRCLVSVGYEGQNPILPPTWGLFIADAEPHVFDGRMYLFGSRDHYAGLDEEGHLDFCSQDYHVLWSDDLVHWNDAGVALRMKDIPADVVGDATRLWAPDVFRDPVTHKYHMVTCTNKDRDLILDADRPEGPYGNARLITLDGKPYKSIDPGALVDDDGKVYIALPKFIVAQLDPEDYSRILPESVRDLSSVMPEDNEPFEGPSLRKRGDTYYYIYIQNVGKVAERGACPTRMAYLTAKAPLGPYEYQGLIVTNYDYPGTINIHGSIEPFEGKWYVAYHRSIPGLGISRVANLDPLTFRKDGTIEEVKMTSSGVRGAFRAGDVIQASAAVQYARGREGGLQVVRSEPTGEPYGFRMTDYPYLSFTEVGQWAGYRYLDFSPRMTQLTVRVAAEQAGGKLVFRRGDPEGEILAEAAIPSTGGAWKEVTVPLKATASGRDAFYLVATDIPQGARIDVDRFSFHPRRLLRRHI